MILEPKENALRMKKKVERRPDRILDARYPEKVERRSDRIPDVRYPGGMSAEKNSEGETSGWNGGGKNSGCKISGWNVGGEEFRM